MDKETAQWWNETLINENVYQSWRLDTRLPHSHSQWLTGPGEFAVSRVSFKKLFYKSRHRGHTITSSLIPQSHNNLKMQWKRRTRGKSLGKKWIISAYSNGPAFVSAGQSVSLPLISGAFPLLLDIPHTWLMCFSLSMIWLTTGSGPFSFSSWRLNWFFIPFLAAFWLYL